MKVIKNDIGWGSTLNLSHDTIKTAAKDEALGKELQKIDETDMGRVGTQWETGDVGDGIVNDKEALRWATHVREGDLEGNSDIAEFVRGLTKEIRTFADVESKRSGNRIVYKNGDAGLQVKVGFDDRKPNELSVQLPKASNAVVILKAFEGSDGLGRGEFVMEVPEDGKLKIDLESTTFDRFNRHQDIEVPLQMLGGRISRSGGASIDVDRRLALIVLSDVGEAGKTPNILDRVILGFPSERSDSYGE